MPPENIPYHLALFAGLASFLSPCVYPLIPAYFTFITGFSIDELSHTRTSAIRMKIIGSTLTYVLGFTAVFVAMGASVFYFSDMVYTYRDLIMKIGGLIIVIFGIHLTGLIPIRLLQSEKRLHLTRKPVHFLGTFFIGMAFGAGWTPCVGPLLGSILILAGNQETVYHGMALLAVYSAGLALPFILLSIFINFMIIIIRKTARFTRYINVVAGILLVVLGISMFLDKLFLLSGIQ